MRQFITSLTQKLIDEIGLKIRHGTIARRQRIGWVGACQFISAAGSADISFRQIINRRLGISGQTIFVEGFEFTALLLNFFPLTNQVNNFLLFEFTYYILHRIRYFQVKLLIP